MIRILLTTIAALVLAAASPAARAEAFRAPYLAPQEVAALPAPIAKAAAPSVDAAGRLKVADVRVLPKAARIVQWTAAAGGFIARLHARSDGAEGLRVRVDLGTVPGAMEVRVQGSDPSRIESMVVDPLRALEAWTPWTEGPEQLIEVFSPIAPSEEALSVGAVLHFTASPFAKAAASCTLSTACTSGDPVLDAEIAQRKKSVMRINFVSGGSGFVCSATLIDTPRAPAAYVLTANHCVEDLGSANSVTAYWFYEGVGCPSTLTSPGFVQTGGGMQLVFTNYNVDATLLLMNTPPPAGALFAPVNAALVADGTPVVNLSHPRGDTSRWATGTMASEARDAWRPYSMYLVNFLRGIIEGGSSGSGMFTRTNGRLELRGILSQGALELSCTRPNLFALFGRMDVFYPQIAQYIGAAAPVADDAPNRTQDAGLTVTFSPIDTLTQPVTLSRRIDYPGDVDIFRFTLSAPAVVSAFTRGTEDTVGALLDANGVGLDANDDAQRVDTNTGLTRLLGPGTYFYSVGHWTPSDTGPYEVVLRADRVGDNYTALWWNAAESGWGLNVNHQGNIVFATLFTYDTDGSPMWLVMSRGDRQADGSYSGALYRTTGPAFNASPWSSISQAQVGAMRLAFTAAGAGTLTYTYNGRSVTKSITRQLFKAPPECTWSAFDRSWETNFQDLWYNPNEPGWGVNVTHQQNTLFATIFTYAPNGEGMWLVMPEGSGGAQGTWSGTLYRTRGPAFDAVPWTPITSIPVGTLTFNFSNGNAGTMTYSVDGVVVTKSIQRQVFSMPKPKCES